MGYELESYIREYPLVKGLRAKVRGNRRIDFLIITKCGKRIGIECKAPKFRSELSYALGQALTYLTAFENVGKPLDKIFILATKIDPILPTVIQRFNLPVGFIAFDKDKHITLAGYAST